MRFAHPAAAVKRHQDNKKPQDSGNNHDLNQIVEKEAAGLLAHTHAAHAFGRKSLRLINNIESDRFLFIAQPGNMIMAASNVIDTSDPILHSGIA